MRTGVAVGWVAAMCLGTTLTRSVRAESVERAAVSLDGALLSVENLTFTPQDSDSAVAGASQESSNTQWGLLGGGFGFGAAYGVSKDFVLAGQLLFSNFTSKDKQNPSGETSSTMDETSVAFYPRAEYVFNPQGRVRPFITAIVGIQHSSSDYTVARYPAAYSIEGSRDVLSLGAGVGLHAFAGQSFSIDPLLSFRYLSGSAESTTRQTGTTGSVDPDKEDISGSAVLLTVSISGWFGGHVTPAATPESLALPSSRVLVSPRPAPAAHENNDSDEAAAVVPVQMTQLIPGDHAITLVGRPEAVPDAVTLRLAESPATQALSECKDVKLVVGEHFYRVEQLSFLGRRAVAGQSRLLSDGTLSVAALDGALDSESSYFDVCGAQWPLTPAARDAIRFFLGEFRQRGGTPRPPQPEPMPGPSEAPAVSPASGTPVTGSASPPAAEPSKPAQAPRAR